MVTTSCSSDSSESSESSNYSYPSSGSVARPDSSQDSGLTTTSDQTDELEEDEVESKEDGEAEAKVCKKETNLKIKHSKAAETNDNNNNNNNSEDDNINNNQHHHYQDHDHQLSTSLSHSLSLSAASDDVQELLLLPIIVTCNLPNLHTTINSHQNHAITQMIPSNQLPQTPAPSSNQNNSATAQIITQLFDHQHQQQNQPHLVSGASGPALGYDQVAVDWFAWELIGSQSGLLIASGSHHVANSPTEFAKAIELLMSEVAGRPFLPLTYGSLSIRQNLHPAAFRAQVNLSSYFDRYVDLQTEYWWFMQYQQQHNNYIQPVSPHPAMARIPMHMGVSYELFYMRLIIGAMLNSGYHLNCDMPRIEVISRQYKLGKGNQLDDHRTIPDSTVIRARGLPWQANEQEIANFFLGLNIVSGGIGLCLSKQGRRNGEALIRFESPQHRQLALARHKHYMGSRYIEVYRATSNDFLAVTGFENKAQSFLAAGSQHIIRMRGLPFSCTSKQIVDFFSTPPDSKQSASSSPSKSDDQPDFERVESGILNDEDGILFVRNHDFKPTGDAFVLFANEQAVQRALQKHHQNIGDRYVELFRSTPSEVQQVVSTEYDQYQYNHSNNNINNNQSHINNVTNDNTNVINGSVNNVVLNRTKQQFNGGRVQQNNQPQSRNLNAPKILDSNISNESKHLISKQSVMQLPTLTTYPQQYPVAHSTLSHQISGPSVNYHHQVYPGQVYIPIQFYPHHEPMAGPMQYHYMSPSPYHSPSNTVYAPIQSMSNPYRAYGK